MIIHSACDGGTTQPHALPHVLFENLYSPVLTVSFNFTYFKIYLKIATLLLNFF